MYKDLETAIQELKGRIYESKNGDVEVLAMAVLDILNLMRDVNARLDTVERRK